MFYTGQPSGGPNEFPTDLYELNPLLEIARNKAMLSSDTVGMDPNELQQLPLYLLPFTLNGIDIDIKTVSDPNPMDRIDTYLNADTAPLVYIRIIKTSFPLDNELLMRSVSPYTMAPENVRKALMVTTDGIPPYLLSKGRTMVIVTNKYAPLMLMNLITMLPYLYKDILKGAEYPIDLKVFHSLGNRKWEDWKKAMLNWGAPLVKNILEKQRKEVIKRYFSNLKANGTTSIENVIITARNNMNQLLEQYQQELKKARTAEAQYRELTVYGRDMTDTIDYWVNKKELVKIDMQSASTIRMVIKTPVSNYDEDELRTYLAARTENDFNKSPMRKNFYRKLFIDRTHTLWFAMRLSLNCVEQKISKADETPDLYIDAIPNTHIQRYDCWGDNKPLILKAVSEINYEMAVEQVVAAIANLNFSDPSVMNSFWSYLTSSNEHRNAKAIVVNATGARMTIADFLKECERE